MKIAHVSDLHFSTFEGAPWSELLGKSLFGALGLALGRRNFLSDAVVTLLESLKQDIIEQDVDLILLTGDLTSLSLPREFERAKAWIESLGPPSKVMIIPGNHDYYTGPSVKLRRFERFFSEYIADPGAPYPMVRRLGDSILLVGLCTAIDSWASNGKVGRRQRQALSQILSEASSAPCYKIVAMHHPPTPVMQLGSSFGRALLDSKQLLSVAAQGKVDLLLHGHEHSGVHYQLIDQKNNWRCEVYDAGSATWLTENKKRCARYNIYSFEQNRMTSAATRFFDLLEKKFVPFGRPREHPLFAYLM